MKQTKKISSVYAVTGVEHGSIITAIDEKEARKIFEHHYDNEKIILIKNISDYNLHNL